MSSRGRILEIHCLRPVAQPRAPPVSDEPLSATLPMRVMLRCRVVFTTGSKLFAVEANTPVNAILALWKGCLRHETDSWELEDKDFFFPLPDIPEASGQSASGLCTAILQHDTFDMRHTGHGSLAQEGWSLSVLPSCQR